MSFLRRHADELLALGLALLLSAEVMATTTPNTGAAVGFALLAGGALALRRTLPLIAFVGSLGGLAGLLVMAPALDGESVGFIVIYFIAHYSLGRWTSGREAGAGAVCLLGSMVAFAVGDAAHNDTALSQIGVGDIAFTVVFVGGPWAAGLAIRLRRAREAALDDENRRLQAEQEANSRRAVAEERARIARELHDVVAHAISVTVLQARGARATLGRDENAVRRALDAIEQTNTAALSDMRRLLAVLRDTERDTATGPDGHAPMPSLARLDRLVAHVRESGVPVEVEIHGNPHSVPPGVDLSAYRIIQEALTNVLKHAGPSTARVTLTYS
ncbi:MAG: histidine kinase, partial [Actinomycetota bacterium]|nr:histidine kinase [Actinomycetota bacterium]